MPAAVDPGELVNLSVVWPCLPWWILVNPVKPGEPWWILVNPGESRRGLAVPAAVNPVNPGEVWLCQPRWILVNPVNPGEVWPCQPRWILVNLVNPGEAKGAPRKSKTLEDDSSLKDDEDLLAQNEYEEDSSDEELCRWIPVARQLLRAEPGSSLPRWAAAHWANKPMALPGLLYQ
ncbi:hypothetical protein Q9233_016226 [Columba guinea]|nr:hypothetical protein Q9233_016226 [Columba guinea]